MITYHQAIELMSYLPMAFPVLNVQTEDQSELAQAHQNQTDLQTLVLNAGATGADDEDLLYTRRTA